MNEPVYPASPAPSTRSLVTILLVLAGALLQVAGSSRRPDEEKTAAQSRSEGPLSLVMPKNGAYTGAYVDFGEGEDDVTYDALTGFEQIDRQTSGHGRLWQFLGRTGLSRQKPCASSPATAPCRSSSGHPGTSPTRRAEGRTASTCAKSLPANGTLYRRMGRCGPAIRQTPAGHLGPGDERHLVSLVRLFLRRQQGHRPQGRASPLCRAGTVQTGLPLCG